MTSIRRGCAILVLLGVWAPAEAQRAAKYPCKCDVQIKTGTATLSDWNEVTLKGTHKLWTPGDSKGGFLTQSLTIKRSYHVIYRARGTKQEKDVVGIPTLLAHGDGWYFSSPVCPGVTKLYSVKQRTIIKEPCDVEIKTGTATITDWNEVTLKGTYKLETPKGSKGGSVAMSLTMKRSYHVIYRARGEQKKKDIVGIPTLLSTRGGFRLLDEICPGVTKLYSYTENTALKDEFVVKDVRKKILERLRADEKVQGIGLGAKGGVTIIKTGAERAVQLIFKIDLVCGPAVASGGGNTDTDSRNFFLTPDFPEGKDTVTFGF